MDNFDKWVAALRSGKYNQGEGSLHMNFDNSNYYCCLGVACVLYQEEVGDLSVSTCESYPKRVRYDTIAGYLPAKVKDWLNTKSDNPQIGMQEHDDFCSCIQLNDVKHKSFSEIADWLEANKSELINSKA